MISIQKGENEKSIYLHLQWYEGYEKKKGKSITWDGKKSNNVLRKDKIPNTLQIL